MTARTPEDMLALVPVVLGFLPTDSVAMLTFGSRRPFHARVDLPTAGTDIPKAVETLLAPARAHGVAQALFVLYSDDDRLAAATSRALCRAFVDAGVQVIEALRTDGHRWYAAHGRRPGVPAWGVPYDLSAHPFLAQAVLDGRVLHGSREELRRTLDGDVERTGRVVAALAALGGRTGDPPPRAAEALWARDLVVRHTRAGSAPEDEEVARLLRGLLEIEVRDAAWGPLDRASSHAHVAFWTDVVRRTPVPLLAAPAALLAFAAWQAGHGALAWCALDRSAEADEDYSLAALVAQALERAVPPDAWDERACG
ncbi:DUF4192 domain-containing protein [Nocardioides sp.]|uniref:DUF4192 domain-containing protein n=1 Tax=Nocardioides sp. TaxID=35761 RepID=UPI00260D7E9B|nr:DUF4192 domain-containing protein [Nocardioides sp.]MDI6908792.1 DUF4192 domain-containing protein [Nocardioides sp.]